MTASAWRTRRLRVQFTSRVGGQFLVFYVSADGDSKGDYNVDLQKFTLALFRRLQDILAAPTAIPSPLEFTVTVQPYVPQEAENVRVRIEPKTLKSKLKLNMLPVVTGVNTLQGVNPPDLNTGASLDRPERGEPGLRTSRTRPASDQDVIRASQSISLPQGLSLPQSPAPLAVPEFLAPGASKEAEQVGKLLTGQPLDLAAALPRLSVPTVPAAASATGAAAPVLTAVTTSGAPTATHPIVVMPAPVVVLPPKPPEDKKHGHSRRRPGLLKSLGNRLGQMMPQGGS